MKSIIFSPESVCAILDGRKTMTRRVVTGIPTKAEPERNGLGEIIPSSQGTVFFSWDGEPEINHNVPMHYRPGDILYVKEPWISEMNSPGGHFHGHPYYYYRADFDSDYLDPCETLSGGYPADCRFHPGCEGCDRGKQRIRWKSSMYMPKEAARLFLRVTAFRVDRVQDITVGDAFDEGIRLEPPGAMNPKRPPDWDGWSEKEKDECVQSQAKAAYIAGLEYGNRHIRAYRELWDSLNAKRAKGIYAWDRNPWVWVVSFVPITKEEALEGEAS